MTNWYAFSAHDTLFFRDGQPFNRDDEGMNLAASRFPPPPSVLIGAFRASLARGLGWDPGTAPSWGRDATLTEQLGDGPEDLGRLTFAGSWVARQSATGTELLFPVPRHLFAGEASNGSPSLQLVAPGQETLASDSGDIRLIGPAPMGSKPMDHSYLTSFGLSEVLSGEAPPEETIVRADDLWRTEDRIGLGIDAASRTASHGMLYQARHVRPADDIVLTLGVDGVPAGASPQAQTALGGFQRLADVKPMEPPTLPEHRPPPEERSDGLCRYLVVLLTPASLPDGSWAEPGRSLAPELPGRIVCGLNERPDWIGGWDGRPDRANGRRAIGPLPLRPYLPAGSVWFMECSGAERPERWPDAIGERQAMGFGRCRIGCWPNQASTS